MYDDNQTELPRSFIELFMPPGAVKPRETRAFIGSRYDLCEDMAQMLTEHASAKLFELGVTEQDVLERMHRGLVQDASAFTLPEAGWIVRRLSELLGWPVMLEEGPLNAPVSPIGLLQVKHMAPGSIG
jgi:hypothetical protein